MKLILLTALISKIALGQTCPINHTCPQVVLVHAPSSTALSGTIANVPPPARVNGNGELIAIFDATNNFDITNASTYADGTPGDWMMYTTSAADLPAEIVLRKQVSGRTSPLISAFSYTGVTRTAGTTSNATWSFHYFSDNDLSEVNWTNSSAYINNFITPGNGNLNPLQVTASYVACAPGGAAIPNCGETFTVTPARAGSQMLHVWIIGFENAALTLLATQTDGKTYTGSLPAQTGSAYYEKVIDITLNLPVPNSPVTVSLTQTGTPSTSDGIFGIKAVALGGATNGGVDPATVSTIFNGGLGGTVGARKFQDDPPSRIPAATTTLTLCDGGGLPSGCASTDLQSAINAAAGGTDIILPANYRATGNFTLPNRGESGWVRLVAANARTFGQRAYETDAMPTLTTPNDQPVFQCSAAGGCHHYALVGLKLNSTSPSGQTYYMVLLGVPSGVPAIFPHDVVLQGLHIHGGLINSIVAVRCDSNAFGLYDSYIDGIQSNYKEAVAVAWDSSRGPITFKNNYLEAVSEVVLTGGGPSAENAETRDIEFTGNWLNKISALQCYVSGACNQAGSQYSYIKNSLEFKQGQYITIKGNLFTKGFGNYANPNDQHGQFISLLQRTAGVQLNRGIDNVDIENNIMRHGAAGIFTGASDNKTSYVAPFKYVGWQHDITIKNNLMQDINFATYAPQGTEADGIAIGGVPANLIIDHNTIQFTSSPADPNPYKENAIVMAAWWQAAQNHALMGYTCCGISSDQPFAPPEALSPSIINNYTSGGIIVGDGGSAGGSALPPNANFSGNFMVNSTNSASNDFTNSAFSFTTGFGTIGGAFQPLPSSWAAMNSINGTGTITGAPGVNMALIPSDCLLYTGNRSDIPCTPGQ